jgi:hypothetical protein
MQDERSPEQDETVDPEDVESHRFVQRDEETDEDDDEVEAHSMGRLSLPEDPNTRL